MHKENSAYLDDDIVAVAEAARFCGLSASTLNKKRISGDGPAFLKVTRLVKYRVGDLREWLKAGRVQSTSEYNARRSVGQSA